MLCWLPLALVGCGGKTTPTAPKTVDDFFPIALGGQPARLQLAVHMTEMQRGLMGRREIGANDGMVFVYAAPQAMSFWMRDTPSPLDIGFFDRDGVLREVYAMQPFDETPIRSHSERLQFAVEMNQGWYRAHGVKPGARLDRAALIAGLRARGFDPTRFGLPAE